jgi:hypothetical protein
MIHQRVREWIFEGLSELFIIVPSLCVVQVSGYSVYLQRVSDGVISEDHHCAVGG